MEEILLLFGKSSKGLDPPPPFPVLLESFEELFLKPYVRKTKVQHFWILVILPHLSWKLSKPMEKSSSKCLELGPPPSQEKVQTQVE